MSSIDITSPDGRKLHIQSYEDFIISDEVWDRNRKRDEGFWSFFESDVEVTNEEMDVLKAVFKRVTDSAAE